MPVQYPVAYNPKTRLEDDIAFASQNLVLAGYTAKDPSQDGNKIKNGDNFTDIVAKLESRIEDLKNKAENINNIITLSADQVELGTYSSKFPSQEGNNLISTDSIKEAVRKVESRVLDLNNRIKSINDNYHNSTETSDEIDSKIAEAIKDFVIASEITNEINNKITESTKDFITTETINNLVTEINNKIDSTAVTDQQVDNRINENLSDYYTKSSTEQLINNKIGELIIPNKDDIIRDVEGLVNDIVDSAPGSLDTLREIANALNNDPDFAANIINQLSQKLGKTDQAYDSRTVNGLTVETAVPRNAIFTDTTYDVFVKSGSSAKSGLVPAPPGVAGSVKFLREDCTWQVPYENVTSTKDGLMSKEDKTKLDNVKVTSVTDGKRYISLVDSTDSVGSHISNDFYVNCTEKKLYAPNIHSSGDITGSRVFNAMYNDYAELMPRGEHTEPGDIVMLDLKSEDEQYIKAYRKNDEPIRVAGVHSDEFGMLIGGEKPVDDKNLLEYNIDKFIPVALSGRVHVKFVGRSEKGAEVVPSSEPGYGRLYNKDVDDPKTIIGYLVESDNKTDKRKLKIRITR